MPVKPRCPQCGNPYLHTTCDLCAGSGKRAMVCACGQPAIEVWEDELGEWALCGNCLQLVGDEFAPLPLPGIRTASDGPLPGYFIRQESDEPSELPGWLTWREIQVAGLAYLKNQEIGRRLGLSKATVRWHLRNIRRKLGVRTRQEIQRIATVLTQVMEEGWD